MICSARPSDRKSSEFRGWGRPGSDTTGGRPAPELDFDRFCLIISQIFCRVPASQHSTLRSLNWSNKLNRTPLSPVLVEQSFCFKRNLWCWHILFKFNKDLVAVKSSSVITILTVNMGNWRAEPRGEFNNPIFVYEKHIWVKILKTISPSGAWSVKGWWVVRASSYCYY